MMDEEAMRAFEGYWPTRPGAPFGSNPQETFRAGFLAGQASKAFPRHPELRSSGWSGAEQAIDPRMAS